MTTTSGPNYPNASLYCGDLGPDVTEAVLFEKFSTCGAVLSIRVCRDLISRRSLGYAYVNFEESADAERALETMNFDLIKGRPVRIMWSQRDPALRKSGVGNIFIKNLDKSIDNNVLFDTFSTFGHILSCKVSQDSHQSSKGYGFVHFDSEEAANNAINKVNGMLLNGKKVFVAKFVPRSQRQTSGRSQRLTNIYVKNFTDDYDDQKLRELFEPFGKVISTKVMTDENGKSKGFGFVSFEDSQMADNAFKQLNGKEMPNVKKLYLNCAQKKAERQEELRRKFEERRLQRLNRYKGINLYVKNLDDSIDDERLHNEFSAFGKITSAKVMIDFMNHSRGFGFVCFSTPEEAQKAISQMNNRIITTKPLYVCLAQTKDERKAFLMRQQMQLMSGNGFGVPSVRHNPQTYPNPHLMTAAMNPSTASMAFVSNPMAFGNGIQTQIPNSWNDIRRNRRIQFY